MAFQMTFAVITPALMTGAIADRMRFSAWVWLVAIWSIVVYAPVAHWVFAGGWLAKRGALDFAGGTVVHVNAGVAALVAAMVLGPRKDYGRRAFVPHNVAFTVLGAGLLWFGWFGFNGGSALAANGVAAVAFVNTNTAAAAGMVTWLALAWWREGKPSMTGALTGAVAGLATVTPAAGYVPPWAAVIIGALAGLICYGAVQFRIGRKWDDALDVWGVHGVGGGLGTILTGVFAVATINNYSGLIAGNARQFGVQVAGVAIAAVYAFAVTWGILKLVNLMTPVRVPMEQERDGLDVSQHGEVAYDLPAPSVAATEEADTVEIKS
jgi:Amt family ammonium transporter